MNFPDITYPLTIITLVSSVILHTHSTYNGVIVRKNNIYLRGYGDYSVFFCFLISSLSVIGVFNFYQNTSNQAGITFVTALILIAINIINSKTEIDDMLLFHVGIQPISFITGWTTLTAFLVLLQRNLPTFSLVLNIAVLIIFVLHLTLSD